MTSRGILALYWPARAEPLDSCATKVTATLASLGTIGFRTFRRLGRSRREAERAIFEPTPENVFKLLSRGVNRQDIDRKPIPELGWRLSLWSGGPDGECFAFSVGCGCYSEYVGNNVLVEFPYEGPLVLPNQHAPARELYKSLSTLWEPEQATLCDGEIHWSDNVLAPSGKVYELKQAALG